MKVRITNHNELAQQAISRVVELADPVRVEKATNSEDWRALLDAHVGRHGIKHVNISTMTAYTSGPLVFTCIVEGKQTFVRMEVAELRKVYSKRPQGTVVKVPHPAGIPVHA